MHVSSLLSKGFRPLMSGHRVADLARLYSLLGRVGGTEALREEWRQYIVATGTAIVKDEPNVRGRNGGRGCWGFGWVCAVWRGCAFVVHGRQQRLQRTRNPPKHTDPSKQGLLPAQHACFALPAPPVALLLTPFCPPLPVLGPPPLPNQPHPHSTCAPPPPPPSQPRLAADPPPTHTHTIQ